MRDFSSAGCAKRIRMRGTVRLLADGDPHRAAEAAERRLAEGRRGAAVEGARQVSVADLAEHVDPARGPHLDAPHPRVAVEALVDVVALIGEVGRLLVAGRAIAAA